MSVEAPATFGHSHDDLSLDVAVASQCDYSQTTSDRTYDRRYRKASCSGAALLDTRSDRVTATIVIVVFPTATAGGDLQKGYGCLVNSHSRHMPQGVGKFVMV